MSFFTGISPVKRQVTPAFSPFRYGPDYFKLPFSAPFAGVGDVITADIASLLHNIDRYKVKICLKIAQAMLKSQLRHQ